MATEASVIRGFTVADLAQRYRVGEDKIRAWINRGEMVAINTGTSACGRPRYVVMPESLAAFEKLRATASPPKTTRRRRQTGPINFFPD